MKIKKPFSSSKFLIGLLSVQALMLIANIINNAPGWDEWAHLPSGLYTLQYSDFSPYNVNPPLTRVVAALPLWTSGFSLDELKLPSRYGIRAESVLRDYFVNKYGSDIFLCYTLGRLAVLPIAIFGTYLIWTISLRLFSRRSAIIASTLWIFSPTVLAFGSTIAPDVSSAVFGVFACWRFFLWYRIPIWSNVIWLGFAIATAMLTKLTWIILPAALCLVLAMAILLEWNRARRLLWRYGFQWAIANVIALFLLNAGYLFENTGQHLKDFHFRSNALGGPNDFALGNNRFRDTWLGQITVPLPANYVYGIDFQKYDFEKGMHSYLIGQWRNYGWWYYYLIAMFLKEPVAVWCLLILGLCVGLRIRMLKNRAVLPLLVSVLTPATLLLIFVSSQTGFNHHMRYVLPFFPAFYIFVGGLCNISSRPVALLQWLLVGWYMLSSVVVLPKSYSYFNELVPRGEGWRYLAESNLDWGQDLVDVRHWMQTNPDKRPVYLVYSGAPVDFKRLGMDVIAHNWELPTTQFDPGYWIVFSNAALIQKHRYFLETRPYLQLSPAARIYHFDANR